MQAFALRVYCNYVVTLNGSTIEREEDEASHLIPLSLSSAR